MYKKVCDTNSAVSEQSKSVCQQEALKCTLTLYICVKVKEMWESRQNPEML